MRRFLAIALVVVSLFIFSSCDLIKKPTTPAKPDDNKVSYQKLYDGNAKKAYDEVEAGSLNRASYGYKFNSTQGYNSWYFVYVQNAQFQQLSCQNYVWTSTSGAKIDDGILDSTGTDGVGYCYLCEQPGTYNFCGTLQASSGGKLTVCKNTLSQVVHSAQISNGDNLARYFNGSVNLQSGDKLIFIVQGKDVYLNPTVTTGSLDDSLYLTRTDWGHYGDLHAYYYNNTVYLYNLWNWGGSQWEWNMQTTTDMFRFVNQGFNASFVSNHYMAFAKTLNLTDFNQYISSRDSTMFFDEDIGKYRYIALSYRQNNSQNVSCDLSMRTSNDSGGMDWGDAVALRTFPTTKDGEPECPAFRKIGNRWYLYCGISKQSVHYVGGLTYWVGGENQTIDEVDWQNAPSYHLDGEDLCVPQIEDLGGRFYMYGWLPRTFNGTGGVYGGSWKNLSREVFVRENGLLGTRLDPMATQLLNKGRYFDVNGLNVDATSAVVVNNNTIHFNGEGSATLMQSCDSAFVTYDVALNNATYASFTATANGKTYRISIVKKSDGIYLEIGCPADLSHPVCSSLYFGETSISQFSVKLIIDGDAVEFYVNDTLALTAKTSMQTKTFTAGFASDGATVSNITINRLAQYYDIYD